MSEHIQTRCANVCCTAKIRANRAYPKKGHLYYCSFKCMFPNAVVIKA